MEKALVLAQGKYQTLEGKSAHGLVRFSLRFQIKGVIDSTLAGKDAGEVLDGAHRGIKIYRSLEHALLEQPDITHLIIGVALSGGALPPGYMETITHAAQRKIHIVNGLHSFLSDDPDLASIAEYYKIDLLDIRKRFRDYRPFFTGKIERVKAKIIAVLGTDSCVGKRTTAVMIHKALGKMVRKSAFVAMGQTGWMQGFKHAIVLDSIILDFTTGAIEEAICRAWEEESPEFIVTHGEGAMLHPAFPGGAELLAAAKPDIIILQHSPGRTHFDDFPRYPMAPLEKNIKLIELYSDKRPLAITISSEGYSDKELKKKAKKIEATHEILTRIPFVDGVEDVARAIISF